MKHTGLADPSLQLGNRRICRSFLMDGRSVLDLELLVPEAQGATLLNQYYLRFCRCLTQYCTEKLIPLLPQGGQPLQLKLDYRIRLLSSALLSLTLELKRKDLPALPAARFGNVWSRDSGMILPLRSFFPGCPLYRRRLNEFLQREALERLRSGCCLYDPRQAERAGKLFCSGNFYADEKGLVLFYPPLTLGSAAEGVPEFRMPWDSVTVGKLRLPHLPEGGRNAILGLKASSASPGTAFHDR